MNGVRQCIGMFLALAGLLLGMVAPVAAARPGALAPAKGMLLVASERIQDLRFRRSVILLVRHDAEGTAGVILNRPTEYTVGNLLPPSRLSGIEEAPVYYGGPLQARTLLTLVATKEELQNSDQIGGELQLVDLQQLVGLRRKGQTPPFRVILGYAGWTAGQLAGELGRGDWFVLPGNDELLTLPPEDLWRTLSKHREDVWL